MTPSSRAPCRPGNGCSRAVGRWYSTVRKKGERRTKERRRKDYKQKTDGNFLVAGGEGKREPKERRKAEGKELGRKGSKKGS